MAKEKLQNLRLGIFVIISLLLLIFAFYLIGSKRNLFGSTFRVRAEFKTVNGLTAGNNVRFSGINVGTVESVRISSDSAVEVILIIETDAQKFIRKNAIASIGTDGLMGNKLVNITAVRGSSSPIAAGDILQTQVPVDTDAMIRTLEVTNSNVKNIAVNLSAFTDNINNRNSLWALLQDTVVADNIRVSVANVKTASARTAALTGNLEAVSVKLNDKNSSIGAFLNDTGIYRQTARAIANLGPISDTARAIASDLLLISSRIEQGEGNAGRLLQDTTLVNRLNQTLKNAEQGTAGFSENMEALKHNVLLRKYFRKLEKEKRKEPKK